MKRVLGAIFITAMIGSSWAQVLTQVGTWRGANGEVNKLYAYTMIVQGTDDNFMLPRGGNFIQNPMATIEPRFGNALKELLGNGTTPNGGLEQPNADIIPVPVNYNRVWVIDEKYLVYGYALLKKGTNPPFTVYNSKEDAIAKIEELRSKRGGETTGGSTGGGTPPGDGATFTLSSSDANGSYNYQYFAQTGVPQSSQEGVVKVLMPSHAIIARDSSGMDPNAAIGVEYKLYDSTNKLVAYVKDTMGGYHPAFWTNEAKMKMYDLAVWNLWDKWRNNFKAFGPFQSAVDRGNNHRDEFTVYLKPGNYRWEFTNIGNTRVHFRADYVGGKSEELFCDYVPQGQSRTRILNIQYSKHTDLKLNANNYGNGYNCGD